MWHWGGRRSSPTFRSMRRPFASNSRNTKSLNDPSTGAKRLLRRCSMRDYTDWAKEDWSERNDGQIPSLSVVLDPILLRKNLRFLSLPPRQWGKLGEIRIHVLRCHKGRCTFEVVLGTTTGVHTLIGKVYAMDASDIFQAME